MKTKRGIYNDIKLSEYYHEVGNLTFFFSSQLYRDKFSSILEEERIRFNQSLNNVYKNKFNITGNVLAYVRLYVLIEKRGFYIKYNGVDITCLEDLHFVVTANYKPNSDE